jgi:hypothetical protein
MQDEFLPLYGVLIAGSLVSAALAVRWILKLHDGTLHLLHPSEAEPDDFIEVPRGPRRQPEPPPPSV